MNSKPMYHEVRLGLTDDTHPTTWEKIDLAMKEIDFIPQSKSNTHCSYLGPFEGTPQDIYDHITLQLYKHGIGTVEVVVADYNVPTERFDERGLGSVRAG